MFAAIVVVGVLAIVVVGLTSRDRVAQTLGVAPAGQVAQLKAGQQLCQAPIGLADDVDQVRFYPGVVDRKATTPALVVALRSEQGHHVLGRALVPSGTDLTKSQTVSVGHVSAGPQIELCFRDEGPAPVAIYGDELHGSLCDPKAPHPYRVTCTPGRVRPTLSTSEATVGGNPLPGDVAAEFLRAQPRSLLAGVPLVVKRASLFRPAFVGPALWWVLIVAWVVGAPIGLAYAVRRLPG